MTPTTKKSPAVTRPWVLRALALAGFTDSQIADLLRITRSAVAQWSSAHRPIPSVTHSALWFIVARISGALGPDDPPVLPAGMGLARLGDAAPQVAHTLARAAKAAIADAPDAATVAAGADLGEELLERLQAQALAEYYDLLRKSDDYLAELEAYKRDAAEREKAIRAAKRSKRGK
jgi:transcriptional regulator with XRE-family HTH domain